MVNRALARRTSVGPVPSQASHDAILDAAEAILTENGTAAGFTMEAVAKRAQAGKPTLYRRWKSKGQLFLELFEKRIAPDLPTIRQIDDTGSLSDQLTEYMERVWSQLTQSRTTIARAVLRELDGEIELGPFLVERQLQFDALLQRAADRGEIASGYDRAAAWDIYASFNIARLTLGKRPDRRELRGIADAIVDGVCRPRRPADAAFARAEAASAVGTGSGGDTGRAPGRRIAAARTRVTAE